MTKSEFRAQFITQFLASWVANNYADACSYSQHDRLENPQGNRGSDPLLMFKTKAEMPEKYREDIKLLDSGLGLKLLAKINDVVRASLPALEGEHTELPDGS